MKELILFGSAFGVVFLLGVQSLNVNNGRYVGAFLTSTLIGCANLVLFKFVPKVETIGEGFAYIIAGPLAIVSAMWFFRTMFNRRVKED